MRLLAGESRHSSALQWPTRTPYAGETVYLSNGQRALLFWTRAQMARGRHRFNGLEAARVTGIDPSNVSRDLRRLASLSLIGHRARRGRHGFHLVWAIGRKRALSEAAGRVRWATRKVATSIPLRGRYLSREGWESAAQAGARQAVRRPKPPRLIYVRCPAGHRVRLARFRVESSGLSGRRLAGSWRGWCRRCGLDVVNELSVELRTPVNDRAARLQRRRDRAGLLADGHLDAAEFQRLEAADLWEGWTRAADAGRAVVRRLT